MREGGFVDQLSSGSGKIPAELQVIESFTCLMLTLRIRAAKTKKKEHLLCELDQKNSITTLQKYCWITSWVVETDLPPSAL